MSLLDKIHVLNTQIAAVNDDIEQARAELGMLQHLADDAARDAAVSEHYDDRADAKMTEADVIRCEKRIVGLEREMARIVLRRDRMVNKLAAQ